MTGGWFKAGTRSHYADEIGQRSLCGQHVAEGSLTGIHTLPARQCAKCARMQAERDAEDWRLARTPAGPVRAPMQTGAKRDPLDELQAIAEQAWREKKRRGRR